MGGNGKKWDDNGKTMEREKTMLQCRDDTQSSHSLMCARKGTGELQVSGKGIHDGRIIDGKIFPADVDADGWFSTGDIISIDKSKGEYLIRGRINPNRSLALKELDIIAYGIAIGNMQSQTTRCNAA